MADEATNPDDAVRLAVLIRPDVAIVATYLRNGESLRVVGRRTTEHETPSHILSRAGDHTIVSEAAASRIVGVLARPMDPATPCAEVELAICRFQETLGLRREAEALRRMLESRYFCGIAQGNACFQFEPYLELKVNICEGREKDVLAGDFLRSWGSRTSIPSARRSKPTTTSRTSAPPEGWTRWSAWRSKLAGTSAVPDSTRTTRSPRPPASRTIPSITRTGSSG